MQIRMLSSTARNDVAIMALELIRGLVNLERWLGQISEKTISAFTVDIRIWNETD